jgi:Leucine-rich repeat (LRR) protein
MKKLLLILLCLPMIGFGQQTYVPDDNFEQELINLGYDNILDDYVITANISYLTILYVNNKNISDMTGIEDFAGLNNLNCSYNQITTLNLNDNTELVYLTANNNNLTTIDISQNNSLTNINIKGNQLDELNIQNGFNNNITTFLSKNNPSLTCILVDNISWSSNNWTNIDPQHYFSNNCPPPSAIQEHTTNKELLKITDLLGRETKQTNQPLFYIYDDGTVERKIVIE